MSESWLSKLRWRLEHGSIAPAVRAIAELYPATDADVIRELAGALSFRVQDVRESAARVLGDSGWRYAEGPLWSEVAVALWKASKRGDDEERMNMVRAAERIEARLQNPPPGTDVSLLDRLRWYLSQGMGFEGDAVRCMTELGPTDDPDAIGVMTGAAAKSYAPRVQKHAVTCLGASGALHAVDNPRWREVLRILRGIPDSFYETAEDKDARTHAIEAIERRVTSR